jgi:[acyl-carrier-protein] S-malonyltransferase
MSAEWTAIPVVREAIAEAEDVLGLPLGRWMLDGPAGELTRTEHAQPALLALGVGVARHLAERGIEAVAAAGHSLGEITALCACESLTLADALRLTHLRGRAMQSAVAEGVGAMVALLGLDEAELPAVLAAGAADGIVAAANINAPGQIVLSGDRAAVDAAVTEARARGLRKAVPLQVSAPFHSPLMAPAAAALAEFLADLSLAAATVPVWSNARLAPHSDDPAEIRAALVEQVTAPVRWSEQLRRMAPTAPGIEVAPAGVLRGLCRRILPDWPVYEVAQPADLTAAHG